MSRCVSCGIEIDDPAVYGMASLSIYPENIPGEYNGDRFPEMEFVACGDCIQECAPDVNIDINLTAAEPLRVPDVQVTNAQ